MAFKQSKDRFTKSTLFWQSALFYRRSVCYKQSSEIQWELQGDMFCRARS